MVTGDRGGLASRGVRSLLEVGSPASLTDGQLLERFATNQGLGSELAFEALLDRHGPMVLRACRGILRDDHEAMDAFQATFLVLAPQGSVALGGRLARAMAAPGRLPGRVEGQGRGEPSTGAGAADDRGRRGLGVVPRPEPR